jgi:hypothetical protein
VKRNTVNYIIDVGMDQVEELQAPEYLEFFWIYV